MPGESKSSPRRIAAKERQRQALQLRIAGASFEQIAEQLGYAGKAGAYLAVKAALNGIPAAEVEEYRRLNLERLNQMRLAVWPQARQGSYGAIDRALKIDEREAKLLGLDAPAKTDVTSGGEPIEFTLKIGDQNPGS